MNKYVSPCFLFFGVLMLGASMLIGYYIVPYKVKETVIEQSKIVEGNTRFKNWEVVPVTLLQRVYFFNVTNPYEVTQGGKPVLQEVGPYVYQQKRRKFDIVFNQENDTIFYKERTYYFFRSDLSNGLDESDQLTFVNIPYVSTIFKASDLDPIARYIISDTLKNHDDLQLYVNTTVGKLMFTGTYLPFMKDLADLRGEEILPNHTFALHYGKNGTDGGRFEIYSGVKKPEKYGDVVTWNGMSHLEWWNDQYCNQINGSDGGIFRPFATKEQMFTLFIPGLCKSFPFTFESDGLEVKGVPVIKYSVGPSFLASAKTNPDNRCYCSNPGENYEKCPEDGIAQLAECGKGAMVLSQPHFYQGSQIYLNQSIGLQPDKERHEMAMFLEPYTSVSARMKLRFQMNVDLKPSKFFKPMKKVPRMVHPLFWIDQTVEFPDDAAAILKEKLHGTVGKVSLFTHLGIIVGSILIILSLLCFVRRTKKGIKEDSKIEGVSYHPQGTLRSEPNGKPLDNLELHLTNRVQSQVDYELETSPFLKQNGNSFSPDKDSSLHHPKEDIPDICTNNSNINTSSGVNSNDNLERNSNSNIPQPTEPLERNCNKTHDSLLSPFPSSANYPSSFSLKDKELVEAVSSYENL